MYQSMNIIRNTKNKSIKFWVSSSVSLALFLVIGALAYTNMRSIIRGVQISAEINGDTDSQSISKISGNAKNATYLSLNGREINLDKNGVFSEDVALPDGYSVVTIEAKDAFGKSARKTLEVYTPKKADSVAVGDITKNIINN